MSFFFSVTVSILITMTAFVKCNESSEHLPHNISRGPLLHEHSLQSPLVHDWWEEGVPHFMIGGSAVATTNFLRLTSNNLDDHGFAFNTAPNDHEAWEFRIKFSIRPPALALYSNTGEVKYQGGDGLAIWYLEQPIGDDHQHILKYSKPITPDMDLELHDKQNPWRVVDTILSTNDEDFDEYEGVSDEDLTEEEKDRRKQENERRDIKRKQRDELLRKIFKRGISVDDTDTEPRIMGVKYSDFGKGFALVLDSVGNEIEHLSERKEKGDAIKHHHHKSSISLLLNLPNHTARYTGNVRNNFDPTQQNFRNFSSILTCEYDFRQLPSKPYVPTQDMDKESFALNKPEEPVELIIQYYQKKLSILLRREDVSRRKIIRSSNKDVADKTEAIDIQRTYKQTVCGKLYPVDIPLGYHFGVSASTGHRKNRKERNSEESNFHQRRSFTMLHVDTHDVHMMELRELGQKPEEMGYSKSIPLERFNYESDKREREHFSRRIPPGIGLDMD